MAVLIARISVEARTPSCGVATDADGYVQIRLGPGTYYLHECRKDLPKIQVATLHWPLPDGVEVPDFRPLRNRYKRTRCICTGTNGPGASVLAGRLESDRDLGGSFWVILD